MARQTNTCLAVCLLGLALFGTAWAAPNLLSEQPGYLRGELIYPMEGRPTPQCHASTLAELPDGTLGAAWFGGTREKGLDVGIWWSRLVAGQWTRPVEVANGVQYTRPDGTAHRWPCWNPVLFQPASGSLLLFFKTGPSPDDWWGMLTTSDDGGKSWQLPRRLPEGISGPVKNKPVALANGNLLCGSSTEDRGWRVHFEWTTDLGRTWFRTEAINDGKAIGAIQPSLLFHPGGRLQALGRSQQGRLWQAWSEDQGKTWSPMTLLSLPNPNAGTDAVTLKDGRHLLVYNHTPRGRSPLNLAVSPDGTNWSAALVLENEPGEFSYPAVIQAGDGRVHISYTWKRQSVKHVVLDSAKWVLQPIQNGQWPE